MHSISIFNGLRYLTKYTHSRVVGLRLEGNLVVTVSYTENSALH